MNFANAIRSLIASNRTLLMQAEGATTTYDRDMITDGNRSAGAPRDMGSDSRSLERAVVGLAKVWHARVTTGVPLKKGRETREAVLALEGVPAVEVAWLLGIHQSSVEGCRRRSGRDVVSGESLKPFDVTENGEEPRRVDPRSLTAPAHITLAGLEE